jgi:hypothetical protein
MLVGLVLISLEAGCNWQERRIEMAVELLTHHLNVVFLAVFCYSSSDVNNLIVPTPCIPLHFIRPLKEVDKLTHNGDITPTYMYHDVYVGLLDLWLDTNVSEEQAASIFRAEVGGNLFLRNVVIYQQVHTALQLRRTTTSSPQRNSNLTKSI